MGINIKNEHTHRLIVALAKATGESQTAAVTNAVQERLDRLQRAEQPSLADRLLAIGQDTAPRLSPQLRKTPHGELLYDENGLPK